MLLGIVVIAAVAGPKTERLKVRLQSLSSIEGASGNDRWAMWSSALATASRAPVLGSGPGTYAQVAGLDKPATGRRRLRHPHNAWLERGVEGGLAGLGLALLALIYGLSLAWRRSRSRLIATRLVAAAGAWVFLAVSLHELLGFGLTRPANAALLALWVGIVAAENSTDHRAADNPEDSPI
jgi:O-antigen ligase